MMTDWQLSDPPGVPASEEMDRSSVLVELLDEIERADEEVKPAPPQPTRTPAPRPFAYD